MTDEVQRGTELLPYILRLSKTLSECLPYAWEARRYLYATLFARNARKRGELQSVVDEFDENWKTNSPSLYQLLPNLVDMFGESSDPDWSWVRTYVLNFYAKRNKENGTATHVAPNSDRKAFRPLASLYYSVSRDIETINENKFVRQKVSHELQTELKEFVKNYPGSRCPVPRRYVNVLKTAGPDVVWGVKEGAFVQIFQRTRELFHFQNEEAHFHHAATIIDFWDDLLKIKHKPDTRNDSIAFEKHAKDMRTLQRLYVGVLETSQLKLHTEEIFKYVTDKMELSRKFKTVRSAASKDFDKSKKLLGEKNDAQSSQELPGLVKQKASLAATLYGLLHKRRKAHDELMHVTGKISIQLRQIVGWEEMIETKKQHENIVSPQEQIQDPPAELDNVTPERRQDPYLAELDLVPEQDQHPPAELDESIRELQERGSLDEFGDLMTQYSQSCHDNDNNNNIANYL